jgi:hypothetical protein
VLGLCFLVIPVILSAEKQRIPRYIDPTGVTMRNGAHFPWHEYRGIRVLNERRMRSSQVTEVGVELLFHTRHGPDPLPPDHQPGRRALDPPIS